MSRKVISIPRKKRNTTTKYFERNIKKASAEITKETTRQIEIMYHAFGIALNRLDGWKQLRIERFVDVSQEVYAEVASKENVSMLRLCYEETGVEFMRDDRDSDWQNIIYLNSENYNDKPLTTPQWLRMKQNQKYWIAAQIEACILIALHRKEGFGAERCGRVHFMLEEVKEEFDFDIDKLKEECLKLTGFKLYNADELFGKVGDFGNG